MMTPCATAILAGSLLLAAPLPQDPPPPASEKDRAQAEVRGVMAPDGDLDRMTLVRSSGGKAVVQFGAGPELVVLEVGDRVGRTAATVREIVEGRLVLDELTRAADERPRRAQIVYREGHTGGRRFMRDPGIDAPVGVKPEVLDPDGKPVTIRKPGKGL
jgi:hypothetical protein